MGKFIKGCFTILFIGCILMLSGYFYARYIEPKQIEISSHTISHSLIPTEFDNLKILQFSDTHIGHYFDLDHLQSIVNKINAENPDIVFFTGDLMDEPNHYQSYEDIIPILSKIEAPFGKFAIYGNHDHGGYGTDIYRNVITKSGFELLINRSIEINKNGEKIVVAGLDDAMLGRPDFSSAFQKVSSSHYSILLAHEPDLAEKSAQYGAHLQLSGHTHGGQIQIPFYGPLITPPLGTLYYEGSHFIGDEQMQLIVNRGLGTTRLPLRFLSKPEITVLTLKQNK